MKISAIQWVLGFYGLNLFKNSKCNNPKRWRYWCCLVHGFFSLKVLLKISKTSNISVKWYGKFSKQLKVQCNWWALFNGQFQTSIINHISQITMLSVCIFITLYTKFHWFIRYIYELYGLYWFLSTVHTDTSITSPQLHLT